METWYLQLEFRMTSSPDKIDSWFRGNDNSWKVNLRRLGVFVTNLHGIAPNFGPEYHKLSELAHPTEQATRQSIAVVLEKNGLADAGVNRWLEPLRKDYCGLFDEGNMAD